MIDNQKVEVLLHGDSDWYPGIVIKARKMWVQLDATKYPYGEFIADENSIKEWRSLL